jgi:pyrimidine deaminase RibD-like protein
MVVQVNTEHVQTIIALSRKCIPSDGAFCVGALLEKEGVVLSTGFSRELSGNTHAEEVCLIKSPNAQGATLYTTMEPCGQRLSGKKCCADLMIEAGIQTIVYLIQEPSHFIKCTCGLSKLKKAGIAVIHYPGYQGISWKDLFVLEEAWLANAHLTGRAKS